MSPLIRRVAIVGGTHGNELTGVYLIRKFERSPHLLKRLSFETLTLMANPEAVAANRRYVDRDLNRCFGDADLADPGLTTHEDQRAKAIAAQLGPKADPQVDVIFDLHSTTSRMGLTLLPSSLAPFNLQLAAYVSELFPAVRVCVGVHCNQSAMVLRSLSPLGCTVEVGAIAQGVLDADLFRQTERLLMALLDGLEALNRGQSLVNSRDLTVYQVTESVDYPRNHAGELQAMIHPRLQFRDYEPLHPGDPMFLTFADEVICYEGTTTVFPIFINEAAYYEKGIAFTLTEKRRQAVRE